MEYNKYIANTGQREYPLHTTTYERLPHQKPDSPEEASPTLELLPEWKDWVVTSDAEYVLPGVFPVELDWFWANIEKGYLLWAPGDHKWCNWDVPPNQVGWVGSIASGGGQFYPGGPVDDEDGGKCEHMDMDHYPFTTCYEHAYVEQSEVPVPNSDEVAHFICIFQYKAISNGTLYRSTMLVEAKYVEALATLMGGNEKDDKNAAPLGGHIYYEISRFSEFLPELYKLWKNHPDPAVNVPNDLRVMKCADGKWAYKNAYVPECARKK